MPWVISDSSILIHLTRINRLSLLERIFGRIAVTPNVWHEVVFIMYGAHAGAQAVSIGCCLRVPPHFGKGGWGGF
jgi:predicted nucleic acid-binding protein